MLRVKRGTLSETKADVLVNVIAGNSRNLAQCGAVASSMLEAGGQKLQQYYDAQQPPVEFGKDVAITRSSGILQTKFVYHALVRNYKDRQSEKLLYNMICKCLNLAVNAEQTSIAFPTVGCGKLGYDPTVVAKCFQRAVRDTRCAMKVYVVAFDEDTFDSFNSVINTKASSKPCYDEEGESAAAAGVGLWSESAPRNVAKSGTGTVGVVSPQPQSVKETVEEHTSDELDDYIREIFPKMSDDELYKLTDHLRSLGIDQPAEMRMLKESDLTGFVKPIRVRILLDAVAAQQTRRSETMTKGASLTAEEPENLTESEFREKTESSKRVKSQMTILLLGETGVGKSTTINSFAVYLRCATLREAETLSKEDLFLIPLHFSEVDPKNYEMRQISVGEKRDANEYHETTGDSVTQDPKIHTMKLPEITITIIDTPGVGDTSGEVKDKENVQKILSCLTNFEDIDAICLLLKPNQARLEKRFKYCLKEILRSLHESARKNIVICFTNGKAVNYKPGDTVTILKKFLSEDDILKQIELNPQTVYYLENEPVRYLAKVKSGALGDSSDRQSAADCWEKSTDQVTRMFGHIAGLPKHMIIGMVSINDARRVIENLTPLLVDVTKCIASNITAIDKQTRAIEVMQQEIKNAPAKKEGYDVNSVMYRDEYKVEVESLRDHSITVCASTSCSEVVNGNYVHTTVCDPSCRWAPTLRMCTAMDWWGNCKGCGCRYDKHEWTTNRRTVVKTRVPIQPTQQPSSKPDENVLEKQDALRILEAGLGQLKSDKQNYMVEKDKMLETCAKLSVFLQQNSIMQGDEANDFVHFLTEQIEASKNKTSLDSESREALVVITQLKVEYVTKRDAVNKQGVQYSEKDVKGLIEDLFKLPLKGRELQNALKVVEDSKAAAVKRGKSEEVHEIKKTSNILSRAYNFLFSRK